MKQETRWPGVQARSKTAHLKRVGTERDKDRWVNMEVGGTRMCLYADTGSKFTIITREQYS